MLICLLLAPTFVTYKQTCACKSRMWLAVGILVIFAIIFVVADVFVFWSKGRVLWYGSLVLVYLLVTFNTILATGLIGSLIWRNPVAFYLLLRRVFALEVVDK